MSWNSGWQANWFSQWFGDTGSEPPTPPVPAPTGPRMYGGGRAYEKHWITAEDHMEAARRHRQQKQIEAMLFAFLNSAAR